MQLLRCHKLFSNVFSKWKELRTIIMAKAFLSTHIERTKSSSRQESMSFAEVIKIDQLSRTVKGLKLKVTDESFGFKPGQWVDFFIPELPIVGGFSICSSPKDLQSNNSIDLAIKYSDHPPAHWAHTKCKVGDKVQMRVGGNFYLDLPQSNSFKSDILLVAGGVGINPLWSMIKFASENTSSFGKTTLLFSASTKDELLFKNQIIDVCNQHPHLRCSFYISEKGAEDEVFDQWTQGGRITKEVLQRSLTQLESNNTRVFICGPQPMIQFVSDSLIGLGLGSEQIHIEKWW